MVNSANESYEITIIALYSALTVWTALDINEITTSIYNYMQLYVDGHTTL